MLSISFNGNNHGLQIVDNRGSINVEFHLAPERPETPPSPLSTVPFTPNPDFVNREALLHQICEKSSVAGSRIALVGLGGVGKSQLAIEYSYQVRFQSPATWVFWVHASNKYRFEQSFRDIADQVKIPGRQDPKVNIFKLVENRLRDEKTGKWVCILDNVDDEKFLCSFPATDRDPMKGSTNAPTKPLLQYIPRSRNGSSIITSRSREAMLKMVDRRDILEVKPMEQSEALELLQRKLDQPKRTRESEQLVNVLEFMPLAIVQAASYIQNRAPRYSVSQYLSDFQTSDRKAIRLLKKEAGDLFRDWEAKNSILMTWQISFDYIRQTKPSAAELLSLMSFCDRQGIPEVLIHCQPPAKCTSRTELSDDSSDGEISGCDNIADFEDDVRTLRNYSFISVSENGTSFAMHRLVQLTTQAWIECHGETERWREKFISNLYEEFPTGQFANWGKCRSLFPHVLSAVSHRQRPKSRESLFKWATLLYRGAWYAFSSENIRDAKKMARESKSIRRKLLGARSEDTLASTSMLAKAYWLEGQREDAERLEAQVMDTYKTNLGVDHPNTLSSMANLASMFWYQGRWDKAEPLFIQIMESRKAKLGEDHPHTLTTMANLVLMYRNQGHWEDAELLEMRVMRTLEMKLDVNHADISTYRNQGWWKDGLIEMSQRELGAENPDTLTSMNILASIYRNQRRWKDAEKLFEQLIEMSQRELGAEHPDTITSMDNLASVYGNQSKWEEAEKLFKKVIEMSKAKLGDHNSHTMVSMANLASMYRKQGRCVEAERLDVQVLEISKAKLGEDHPETLTHMSNLASTYWTQRRFGKAEKLFKQVIETRRAKLGVGHADTLASMAFLASMYRSQDRREKAEQLDVQIMEIRNVKLGKDHPVTLRSMAKRRRRKGNRADRRRRIILGRRSRRRARRCS